MGGAFAVVFSAIPIVTFLAGGALAVVLYRRRVKDQLLSPAAGARLGAASGGFGCLYFMIIVLAMFVYHREAVHEFMSTSITQMSKYGYSPETIHQLLELIESPEGFAYMVGLWLFTACLVLVVGGSIGGAWYSAWLRKRMRH
jgi:hypothetical protein